MKHIGLKELRQHASDIIKRAEAGETITITVAGRDAAVLSPIAERSWHRYSEVQDLFSSPTDPEWATDLRAFDESPRDPWTQQ
ncbi:type II toxin-antitoxin system Phd/YefM family antitoxin [Arthrobacter sp. CAN_A1]|uniref:type II toxin-antitoxin system Phd/YefM family antitoxin n=1 Tax=Arthrobacter sp. CAN_A1 TaxID=2787717 RepID=UPI0018CB2FDA